MKVECSACSWAAAVEVRKAWDRGAVRAVVMSKS